MFFTVRSSFPDVFPTIPNQISDNPESKCNIRAAGVPRDMAEVVSTDKGAIFPPWNSPVRFGQDVACHVE
jgi:hypothetical protein